MPRAALQFCFPKQFHSKTRNYCGGSLGGQETSLDMLRRGAWETVFAAVKEESTWLTSCGNVYLLSFDNGGSFEEMVVIAERFFW